MKRLIVFIISIFLFGVVISGCTTSSTTSKSPNYGTSSTANPYAKSSASNNSISYPNVESSSSVTLSPEELQRLISTVKKEIHFKFNSAKIEPIDEYGIDENPNSILDSIAEIMKNNSSIKLRIEGNCDERGTEEYNLALGQRRALVAKRYLVNIHNIEPSRIDTLSYGESQPIDPEHNEIAWAKNRRDHFVFVR